MPHVQIIETASILHLQWAIYDTTTVLVQLGQAESVDYSYSELSYVSAKLPHVQIIETASILHLQWAIYDTTTVLVQLGQAESVDYSYSELSYVSAKLIPLLLVYRYMARFVEVLGS